MGRPLNAVQRVVHRILRPVRVAVVHVCTRFLVPGFSSTCLQGRVPDGSFDSVPCDHFAIPFGAEFRSSFLCLKVYVMDAEAIVVPINPFKVIQQAPEEVSLYGVSFSHRPLKVHEVVSQVHDAVNVLYTTFGA